MSDKKLLNRREFLERAALMGALTVGAGSMLSACDPPDPQVDDPDEPDEAAEPEADGISCNDEQALADLTDDEIGRREAHEYVDATPIDDQTCDNCLHWEEPAAGEDCGGCAMLPGPFHPDGWCNIWAPAA